MYLLYSIIYLLYLNSLPAAPPLLTSPITVSLFMRLGIKLTFSECASQISIQLSCFKVITVFPRTTTLTLFSRNNLKRSIFILLLCQSHSEAGLIRFNWFPSVKHLIWIELRGFRCTIQRTKPSLLQLIFRGFTIDFEVRTNPQKTSLSKVFHDQCN